MTKNNTQITDKFFYFMLFNAQKMGKSSITCKKPVFKRFGLTVEILSTSSNITHLYLKNCSGGAVMLLDTKMSPLTQAVMWREVSWEYLGAVHQLMDCG